MVLFPLAPGGGEEVEHGYKGKGSLIHLLVDQKGLPLWITNTLAKGDERHQALMMLDQIIAIRVKSSKKLTICEADKGYDADSFRQQLLLKGYLPVIGYRKNRKENIGTEEVADFFRFTRRRWVVERTFSWLKRKCRRLLMRWERLANLWDAFAKLGLIYMWLGYLVG